MSDINDLNQKKQLQVKMDDQVSCGKYSNLVMIHFNDSEFVLDFLYVQPQQPLSTVQSRIITSPKHIKRLLTSLQQQLVRYENIYGEIKLPPPPEGVAH